MSSSPDVTASRLGELESSVIYLEKVIKEIDVEYRFIDVLKLYMFLGSMTDMLSVIQQLSSQNVTETIILQVLLFITYRSWNQATVKRSSRSG